MGVALAHVTIGVNKGFRCQCKEGFKAMAFVVEVIVGEGTDAFSQSGLYPNYQDIAPRYSISFTHEDANAILGLDDIRDVQPFSPTNIDPTPIYPTQISMDRLDFVAIICWSAKGCKVYIHLEVLGRQTVLKSDHCPGCQHPSLPERVDGAPNFREIPCFPVYGVANPTVDGILSVISRIGSSKGGRSVFLHNMREEPVIYINGKPFVLCEVERPYKNMLEYRLGMVELESMLAVVCDFNLYLVIF
ncbi:hypothetical protein AgCh_005028 [Apium graveolens]